MASIRENSSKIEFETHFFQECRMVWAGACERARRPAAVSASFEPAADARPAAWTMRGQAYALIGPMSACHRLLRSADE
jgi:hypothetical protein